MSACKACDGSGQILVTMPGLPLPQLEPCEACREKAPLRLRLANRALGALLRRLS